MKKQLHNRLLQLPNLNCATYRSILQYHIATIRHSSHNPQHGRSASGHFLQPKNTTMNLALLAFIPAAAAQTLIFPGVSPFRLGDGNITAKATRDGWDTAFATINATGSATIPGKNIRAPFPGNSSSDWKYTISVRDDVPHANGSGFFTATWLQLEAPQELLTETTVNETRKVQTIARDDSWDVCTYVFFGEEYSISDKTVGPGCEGFWEDPGACAKGLEEALVNGFGEEETEIMGKKTRCALPWPSLVPMTCRSGGVGSMLGE